MERIVVRQPIFDRNQDVFGYRILCACHGLDAMGISQNQAEASLQEIENTFLLIGFDKITGGKKAFVDFTGSLAAHDTGITLPAKLTIVEIANDPNASETFVASCRNLKEAGYTLAADHSILSRDELLPLIDIVMAKVGNPAAPLAGLRRLPSLRGKKLLAEGVDTREAFELALEAGCDYFQGFFFSEPVILSLKEIPQYELTQLKVLREVNRKDMDFASLEIAIKQDVSLSYRLLRYINSAFFGLRREVSSIRQALSLLGEDAIRRWASLVILTRMAKNKPAELVVASLIRAYFCESLAFRIGLPESAQEAFTMGLFSMLDVLLGRPLREILEEMPLSEPITAALSGKRNKFRRLFDLVVSYERGEIKTFSSLASKLNIAEGKVTKLYLDAIERAEDALQFCSPYS